MRCDDLDMNQMKWSDEKMRQMNEMKWSDSEQMTPAEHRYNQKPIALKVRKFQNWHLAWTDFLMDCQYSLLFSLQFPISQ